MKIFFIIILLSLMIFFAASAQQTPQTGSQSTAAPSTVKPDPNLAKAISLFNQAQKYQQTGKTSQAIIALKEAVKLNPKLAPAYFNLGLLHIQINKSSEAIAYLRRAAELEPANPSGWIEIAAIYLDMNRLKDAEAALIKAKPNATKNSRYFTLRGIMLMSNDKSGDAIKSLEKAVSLDPKNYLATLNLGSAYGVSRQYKKAISVAKKAIALQPKNPTAYKLLANAYEADKQIKPALQTYQRIINLGNADVTSHLNLARLYQMTDDVASAEKQYKVIVKAFPLNYYGHYMYAGLLYRLQKWSEAEHQFREAVTMDPKSIPALIGLAGALLMQKKYDESEKVYLAAKAKSQSTVGIYEGLGYLYDAKADTFKAAALYKEWAEKFPGDERPLLRLAAISEQRGDYNQSDAYYQKAIKLNPRNAVARSSYAQMLAKSGKQERAFDIFDNLMKENPNDIEVRLTAAGIYVKNEKLDEALKIYEAVKQAKPKDSRAYYRIAEIYDKQKKSDSAVAEYKRYLEISPNDSYALLQAKNILEQEKRYDEAAELLLTAMKNNKDSFWIVPNLATLYNTSGQPEKGIALYEEVINKEPENKLAIQYFGFYLKSINKFDMALKQFCELARIEPENIIGYKEQAVCLISLKRHSEALPLLKKTLEMNPDTPDAWTLLRSVYTELNQPDEWLKSLLASVEKGSPKEYPVERLVSSALNPQEILQALTVIANRRRNEPNSMPLLKAHAKLMYRSEMYSDSLKLFDEYIKKDVKDLEMLQQAALAADKAGALHQRIKFYKAYSDATLDRDPNPSLTLAELYFESGDKAAAIGLAKSVYNRWQDNTKAKDLLDKYLQPEDKDETPKLPD